MKTRWLRKLPEIPPGVFGRIAFWGSGGNMNQSDIAWDARRPRTVPSCRISDHGSLNLWAGSALISVRVELRGRAESGRWHPARGRKG